jgi:hypothetical protein
LAESKVTLKLFVSPVGFEWTSTKCPAMKFSSPSRRRDRRVLSPEEYKKQRRERRMERTSRLEEQVRVWAEAHGCSLRVLNDGHHWLFQKPGFMAEWWPSSARLALNRDYGRHIHAPHWAKVLTELEQYLSAPLHPQRGASALGGQPTASLSFP